MYHPLNNEDTNSYLKIISGNKYKLYTSVCIFFRGKIFRSSTLNKIKFKRFNKKELKEYLQNKDWRNLNSSYLFLGLHSSMMKYICGNINTVLGLPINEIRTILNEL